MRLWTVHPKYLDSPGLTALWREALLARAVIRGETRGCRHHPQLLRFTCHPAPRSAINAYPRSVLGEARVRGYVFDARNVGPVRTTARLRCTRGQLDYEWRHLLCKLKGRHPIRYRALRRIKAPEAHPLFIIRRGPVEQWARR